MTLWSTIVGVDSWLTGSQEIDLYLANSVPSATEIKYRVSTIADNTFYLESIVLVVFAYNANELLQYQRSMKVTYGTFDAVDDDGTDKYTDTGSILRSTNSIVGIYSYRILYQTNLQYELTTTNFSTIVANTGYHFKYVAYNFMIFEFVKCNHATDIWLFVD